MADVLEQIELLREHEERVAMATLVGARGGRPRPRGAKLVGGAGGRLLGSVSIGGCVDARVVEHGDRLLRENRTERVTVVVDDLEAIDLGLTCGAEFDLIIEPVSLSESDPAVRAYRQAARLAREGQVAFVTTTLANGDRPTRTVSNEAGALTADGSFVERIAPAATLLIVGASDVGAAVARLARAIGMRVVVIDGRERYATRERFAAADEILVGMPSDLVRPRLTAAAYLLLVAHEYKYELPILRDALRSPVCFVGMLSGRKRAQGVRALLHEQGLGDDEIARLHAPVGLDIGGREPEEIAVSIIAQLIAVREGKAIARREQAV